MSGSHQAELAKDAFESLQIDLQARLESIDPEIEKKEDRWTREEGGGGTTLAFERGTLIEKGGVNFSDVHGKSLPPSATQGRPELEGSPFRAMGVSVVFHPDNPHLPTSHANVRYFEASPPGKETTWWFGGGFDLTPVYGFVEDAVHWHQVAADACGSYGEDVYPRMKAACDEYFWLPHRKEPRGIGGIFFDDLSEGGFARCEGLARSLADAFLPAYLPILERRKDTPFTAEQRDFQLYRRGRYVEFNLAWDRGTRFGLQAGARTESLLASLPPVVHWRYDWSAEPGTPEAELVDYYLQGRDWLGEHGQSS